MKFTYEFVTGEIVEIEVDEKWDQILLEIDQRSTRIDRRETRRHQSLNTSMEGSEWLIDAAPSPDETAADLDAKNRLIAKAERILTEKQMKAFRMVCIEKYTEKELAETIGISQQAVHKHVAAAKKKMKKFLK